MTREEQIRQKQEEITKLEREIEEERKKPDNHRLAELIHERFCNGNHIDWCDWFYGTWENPRSAMIETLKKADRILAVTTFGNAEKVISLL